MPNWTKEQSEAIEKSGSNIIVSAGAGSGKTAVLSERVLEKVKNGIHINELLILTFTKLAAAEMKDRIRKKLVKNGFNDEVNLLSSSYITTFDSFALSIVKKYHYLLNLSSNISITDESLVKIEEKKIIDEIFESLYVSGNTDFENLIKNYCVKNDNYLRSLILGIASKIDGYIDSNDYINYIENYFYTDENIESILSEYENFINEKKRIIKLELNNMESYFDNDYMESVHNLLNNLLNSNPFELNLYGSISFPRVRRGTEEDAKILKERVKNLVNELLSYGSYGNKDDIKYSIINTKSIVFAILDIVKLYIKKLNTYKTQNNIYTFNDIARFAIKILKENDSAKNELKYSFKEIMIDEYQDTNDVQELLMSYIENNNVYMVGDIKQSIYRFRGSNPNIFKNKYDKYFNNDGGYKIDLVKNFRSRNEVINNINNIFKLLMDDEIGGANYKLSHEMVYGLTKYDEEKVNDFKYDIDVLEYENASESEYDDSEIEIFTIAKDIKDKINSKLKVFDKNTETMREATYSDFVIILDRSNYFNDFKKIFEYMGIPLTVLRDDKLNTSNDILIIKNIIDFIIRIHNKDFGIEFRYDFMSIGRSFLYEYSDSELFEYFKNNNFYDSKLFKDFSNFDSLNSMSCSEVLDKILDITDFYSKIYKIGNYEDVNVRIKSIYNLSIDLNNIGYSILEFRDYLNEILDNGIDIKYKTYNSNNDSVKIMTIHASKGLEYPICYFADLDHKFNTMELKDLFIVDRKYGIIVPNEINDNNKNETSILKELYKNNFMKEEISEKLRLFYVALTRAREKLIIIVPKKDVPQLEKDENGVIDKIRRLSFNKLSDFIIMEKPYLNDYFSDIDINSLNLTKDYLLQKNKINNINKNSEEFVVNEISIENEEVDEEHFSKESIEIISKDEIKNMEFGTKIHEMFELIDFKNYEESIIKNEFCRNKINKFMKSKLLDDIENANIYHEYEFMYEKDNTEYHGIIDLMIEHDDYIDLVDFKLKNTTDEKYIKQLNGYKNYINSISDKKVNLYLYSIIDEKVIAI